MEITPQQNGERLVRILDQASVGPYIILGDAEFKVLALLDEA